MSFDAISFGAANSAKLPIGFMIKGYGTTSKDWLPCDGRTVLKDDYPAAYTFFTKNGVNSLVLDTTNNTNLAFGSRIFGGYPRSLIHPVTGKSIRGKMTAHNMGLDVTMFSFFGVDDSDYTAAYGSIPVYLHLHPANFNSAAKTVLSGNSISPSGANTMIASGGGRGTSLEGASNKYIWNVIQSGIVMGSDNRIMYAFSGAVRSASSPSNLYICSFNNKFNNFKIVDYGTSSTMDNYKNNFSTNGSSMIAYSNKVVFYRHTTAKSDGTDRVYSTDSGETWVNSVLTGTTPTNHKFMAVIKPNTANQKVFLFNAVADNKLYVSNDGDTGYTATPTFDASNITVKSYKVVNDRLFFWDSTRTKIYHTADGVTFANFTFPDSRSIVDIGYVAGLYVIVAESSIHKIENDIDKHGGTYYTSSNLTGWTKRDFPNKSVFNIRPCIDGYQGYMASNADNSVLCFLPNSTQMSYLLRTTDGINWEFVKYSDTPRNKELLDGNLGRTYKHLQFVGNNFYILDFSNYKLEVNTSGGFAPSMMFISADGNFWGVDYCDRVVSDTNYVNVGYSLKDNGYTVAFSSNYYFQGDIAGERVGIIPSSGGNITNGRHASTATLNSKNYVFKDEMLFEIDYNATSDKVTFNPVLMISRGWSASSPNHGYYIRQLKDYILFCNSDTNDDGGFYYWDGNRLGWYLTPTYWCDSAAVDTNEVMLGGIVSSNYRLSSAVINSYGSVTRTDHLQCSTVSGGSNDAKDYSCIKFGSSYIAYQNTKNFFVVFTSGQTTGTKLYLSGDSSDVARTYQVDFFVNGNCVWYFDSEKNTIYRCTTAPATLANWVSTPINGLVASNNVGFGSGSSLFTSWIQPPTSTLRRNTLAKCNRDGSVFYTTRAGILYFPTNATMATVIANSMVDADISGTYDNTISGKPNDSVTAFPLITGGIFIGTKIVLFNNENYITNQRYRSISYMVTESDFKQTIYGVNHGRKGSSGTISRFSNYEASYLIVSGSNTDAAQGTTVRRIGHYRYNSYPLGNPSETPWVNNLYVFGRFISQRNRFILRTFGSSEPSTIPPYKGVGSVNTVAGCIHPNVLSSSVISNYDAIKVTTKQGVIYANYINNSTVIQLSVDGIAFNKVAVFDGCSPIRMHQSCNSDDIVIAFSEKMTSSIQTNQIMYSSFSNSDMPLSGFLHSPDGGLNWYRVDTQKQLDGSSTYNDYSSLVYDGHFYSNDLYKDSSGIIWLTTANLAGLGEFKLLKESNKFNLPNITGYMVKVR